MRKKLWLILILITASDFLPAQAGKVGINTTAPQAMLHVKDSSVLFSGSFTIPSIPGNPPASGDGVRMMWYPDKAAFRAGAVESSEWNKENIGDFSFATGYRTIASGFASFAAGTSTNATSIYSVALGNGTTASGNYSTAMGISSVASARYSTAMGLQTRAKGYSSLVVGMYNDSILTTNEINVSSTTPLFIIGNGDGNSSRSNAIVVLKNGKTGINTNSPMAMLHVQDSNVVFTGALNLPENPGNVPVSGTGVRMMWYADKAAFRAGRASGTVWDKDNIGDLSFATGQGNLASGHGSVAMGVFNSASGSSSTAMGNASDATGTGSTAMGIGTEASGLASTAMGNLSSAKSSSSTAMGYETNAKGFASTVVGLFNDSILVSNELSATATTPLFIVGNGDGDNSRSNALVVRKNAKTGVNISSPQAMLHIVRNGTSGGSYISNPSMIIEDNTNSFIHLSNPGISENGILSGTNATTIRSGVVFKADSSISFRTGGNFSRMELAKNGNLSIDGTLSQNSDVRLKENIKTISNGLQKIISVNGYNYYWKTDGRDNQLQAGVLAQEILTVMPELVTYDDKGVLSVNYSGIIPYLIEAIKELKEKNDLLTAEFEKLKRSN
jgi:Chaperone of endosialidase/Head domain of trimeric autotransporter adhesin